MVTISATRADFVARRLERLPATLGQVKALRRHPGGNGRFVVIFHDIPWNSGARLNIVKAIEPFVRSGTIELVGEDGAVGEIDPSVLRDFPIAPVRKRVAERLMEDMQVSPPEFCAIVNPGKPFVVCGLEDADLLRGAQHIWGRARSKRYDSPDRAFGFSRIGRFNDVELDRAIAMVRNLHRRMEQHEARAAAVVCTGNLPTMIASELNWGRVSHALVEPASTGVDRLQRYADLMRGTEEQAGEEVAGVRWDAPPMSGDLAGWYLTRMDQLIQDFSRRQADDSSGGRPDERSIGAGGPDPSPPAIGDDDVLQLQVLQEQALERVVREYLRDAAAAQAGWAGRVRRRLPRLLRR